ncbi:TetR family transcriptional regulator [Rhizobium vallis]|uniref:TetR family transcriptional regulator n=1 Tax=Rhizobium vallis TaxID=634290 RepID=A0A432PGL0_9HYPH|nr:TetR/AcrR family transcriptional regulator C-terminal domain-containing protein [Rhizobium vallis]RUM23479.1 TetR family transcriptional regulator [Rhizobium vallis]
MKVDRARIVDEALKLLNEVGIDALSTRLLAERLDVRQPALYWHFKSKRALIEAMNAEILIRGHKDRWPQAGDDWQDFLIKNARSFRRALLAYRDGGRVHAGTEGDPQDVANVESHLQLLVDAGMTAERAIELLVSLGRYTLGCVIEEQTEPPPERAALDRAVEAFPLARQALAHYRNNGQEAFFETGLRTIVEGAALWLAPKRS